MIQPTLDQLIAAAAGILLSLAMTYTPGLRVKWNLASPEARSAVMLLALALVSVAIFLMTCGGVLPIGVSLTTCDKAGAVQLFWLFVTALVTNQTTHAIAPLPTDARAARVASTSARDAEAIESAPPQVSK